MGLERRGIILYKFCKTHYPQYTLNATQAWIEAGMSLKKEPAEAIRTKHVTPPDSWEVAYGKYDERLRLCKLPVDDNDHYIWYAFNPDEQGGIPIFKATS